MEMLPASQVKGKVQFGLITVRCDEFEAVLDHFAPQKHAEGASRLYALHYFNAGKAEHTVAVMRCPEPGEGEAQDAARDLIDELDPHWLVVVGIAGAVPHDDFSLGDVIVATQIVDFSREATRQDRSPEYDLTGGPAHKEVLKTLAHLPALRMELGDWNSEKSVTLPRPGVTLAPGNFYGPEDWQKKTKQSLEKLFGANARNLPLVETGPVASSDRLMKDTERLQLLLSAAQNVRCVEMEAAGVYRAARCAGHEYPLLVVRGLSDMVGFKRDDDWTRYACHTAGSLTAALFRLIAPQVACAGASGSPSASAGRGGAAITTVINIGDGAVAIDDAVASGKGGRSIKGNAGSVNLENKS